MKKIFLALLIVLSVLCLVFVTGCNATDGGVNTETEESQNNTEAPTEAIDPTVPYQFRSGDLGHYYIVYESGNSGYQRLATRLKTRISQKYGFDLTVKRDTELEPTKYEILLGDTNRYDHYGRVMEYSVTVDEGKFRINVGGQLSAEKAITYICENVFNGQALTLDNGEYYKTLLLSEVLPVTEGATARIMSANILADSFSDQTYNNAAYRGEIFAGILATYTPDVLGLQEVDDAWSRAIDGYLTKLEKAHGISYSRCMATYEDKINYTSLLYRSDKFKAENSGVSVFSWWDDPSFGHSYHMRNISWVELSSVSGTERFIVANTHWSYRTEHSDGGKILSGASEPIAVNELRMQCKDETDSFMTELHQRYPDTPIFLTGDFNTSLIFFTESGWTPTDFNVISEEAKESGVAHSTVPEAGHYDHIFGIGEYSIKRYAFFGDTKEHKLLTDHPFVYVDIDLKS